MEVVDQRFECFPDPLNNWMVWDIIDDDVARIGNERLIDLPEDKAQAACALLNDLAYRMAA
ncbi:hypothetical protein ACSVBT_09860 [Afipia sp. TerB]